MADKPGKQFGDQPGFWQRLRALPKMVRLHLFKGRQYISVDYRVRPRIRYGYGQPPNPYIYRLLDGKRQGYKDFLTQALKFSDDFARIPLEQSDDPCQPYWANTYIPPLDGISIYSMLAINRPARLLEIGSGNSTKFARRAITDHNLPTKITSIDPLPRAECDELCDRLVRDRFEDTALSVIDELEAGDVLYMDGSHRCFPNSDVTVFFLEVLPRLKSGVIVAVHDILLPYDYPPRWMKRFYSEQYVMGAYMLGCGADFDVLLANSFISRDKELSATLNPLRELPVFAETKIEGWLLWFRHSEFPV
jgi:hypothetical protein